MKKILFLTAFFLCTFLIAEAQQVPQGMTYQAVARDLKGQVMADQSISLKITLYSNSERQKVQYSETHDAVTNKLGLFSLVIGAGDATSGAFSRVPWSSEEIWMELAIDEEGGQDFAVLSKSKLLAVPYAFHAATASEVIGLNSSYNNRNGNSPGVPSQNWSLFGNSKSDPTKDKLGTTDCADLVLITNNEERLRILCSGEVFIDSDLDVGNDLTVQQNVEVNISGGNTIVHGELNVVDGSNSNLTGNLIVDGTTDLNSDVSVNNESPTNLTGTLNVDGVTDINNDFNVTNNSPTNLTGTLNVDGVTHVNNNFNVTNNSPTNLTGALNVDGVTHVNNNFNVTNNRPTNLSGVLNVMGATGLNNTLNVAGATNINNTLAVSGNISAEECLSVGDNSRVLLKFNPDVTNASQNSFNNYPLQLSGNGASQGMAIKVNNWQSDRNFVAFFAEDAMRGRIEGKNGFIFNHLDEMSNDLMEYDPDDAQGDPIPGADTLNVNASSDVRNADTSVPTGGTTVEPNLGELVQLIILAVDLIGKVVTFATSFSSWLDPLDIFEAAISLTVGIASLASFIGFGLANIGVAYESGNGDYAEWLQKENIEEVMSYGDVVGVVGGKISKDCASADKFMIISAAPAVIGNMPQRSEEDAFETVAFMGQIPVKVRGTVLIGDYILPSGDNDGLAIAISKEKMRAKDYGRIIGVAWENSKEEDRNKFFQMIKTAVGINQNDLADMVDQMQVVMNQMQAAISEINPDYEGFVFDTNTKTVRMGADYSVSPTHESNMKGYFDGKEYNNREELGLLVKDAIITQAGIDLSEYPLVDRMLTDPVYAESAKNHYSKLMVKYMALLEEHKGK